MFEDERDDKIYNLKTDRQIRQEYEILLQNEKTRSL